MGRVLLGLGLLETVLAFAQVLTDQGDAWWKKGSEHGKSLLQEGMLSSYTGEGLPEAGLSWTWRLEHVPPSSLQAAWLLGVQRPS